MAPSGPIDQGINREEEGAELNVSPWILYAFNIMWQIAHVACPTSCWLTSSQWSNLWVDTSNLHVTTQTLVTCAIYLHNYVHFVIVYLTLCALVNKVSITTLSDSVGPLLSRGTSERLVISGGDISKYLLIEYYRAPIEVWTWTTRKRPQSLSAEQAGGN